MDYANFFKFNVTLLKKLTNVGYNYLFLKMKVWIAGVLTIINKHIYAWECFPLYYIIPSCYKPYTFYKSILLLLDIIILL